MKKVRFAKARQFLKGKGFMMALVLSLAAVGTSTYIAYDQAISKISLPGTEDKQEEIISFSKDDGVAVSKGQPDVPKEQTPTERVDIEAVQALEPVEEVNNFVQPKAPRVMPVDGEVSVDFSEGELVKSKTLGVWKTHDGIDIAAPLGTPVVAMTNGTVTEVYSDPLWGICVVVDHTDGVFGHYYGLDKNVSVTVGLKVNSGDTIGLVGNTAEIEIAEPSHLHFGLKKNDQWINPREFIDSIR